MHTHTLHSYTGSSLTIRGFCKAHMLLVRVRYYCKHHYLLLHTSEQHAVPPMALPPYSPDANFLSISFLFFFIFTVQEEEPEALCMLSSYTVTLGFYF